jgi:hypothetical protein
MPQVVGHSQIITILKSINMQSLTLKPRQSEPKTSLVDTPVKEREKIRPEILSLQNTSAMDVMGLSWIFVEDDYS